MSEDVVYDHLRRVPLFADVPPEDLRSVAKTTRPVLKEKSSVIYEEGSPADSCYVITSGRAKVVLSGLDASEVILNWVGPAQLIGELSLIDGSLRSASLVALDECRLLRLPKPSFLELRNNRAFEDKLFAHVTAMLRRETEQLRVIYTYNADERVSWSLARFAIGNGWRNGEPIVITPKPTRGELASMAGCEPETVSRVMLKLKKAGLVIDDRHSFRLDPRAFRTYLESAAHCVLP